MSIDQSIYLTENIIIALKWTVPTVSLLKFVLWDNTILAVAASGGKYSVHFNYITLIEWKETLKLPDKASLGISPRDLFIFNHLRHPGSLQSRGQRRVSDYKNNKFIFI